jgi:hypothetical protein
VSTRSGFLFAAAAMAALAISTPALATQPTTHTGGGCFLATEWQAWKSPSPDVIYVLVGTHDVYRFDLSSGSNQLNEPDVHLSSQVRGSDWICSPLDLQLDVVSTGGIFREPLIVKSITKLTPEEIAAIPPKYRP